MEGIICNCPGVDLSLIESVIAEHSETLNAIKALLAQIYSAQLFFIGVCAAVFVCVLLYRFLRQFY